MDPIEESIRIFEEMAPGVPRDEVIQRIKSNGNNVEQAINEYYDNPDASKYSWDKISFRSGPDISPENHGTSYGTQGVDAPEPFRRFSGAPTRPPSRTNNTSPLGSGMINIDQDPELTKALAISAQEAGLSQLNSNNENENPVYFGPATREIYNTGQWSMVPLGKSTDDEFACEQNASDRMRGPGAPAFLTSKDENHRLGALITIYHQIPMMRNIFLNTTDILNSYGYDKEWWLGKPIILGDSSFDNRPCAGVDRELQRLMAFLDNTERSYGSVDALTHLLTDRGYSKAPGGEDKCCALLEAWRQLYQENNPGAIKQIFSVGVASEETEQDEKKFAILELIPPNSSLYENLYDICDECLWPDLYPLELASSPYLSHVAEIFTFKIETSNGINHVEIPAIWYPDRYLKPSREASMEMRRRKREIREQLDSITRLEERLTNVVLRNGKSFTVKHMLETCIKHDEASVKDSKQSSEEFRETSSLHSSAAEALSVKIRLLNENIVRKLTEIGHNKKILYSQLRQLATLYTCQSSTPNKLKPYSLRGICCTNNIMYLCHSCDSFQVLNTSSGPSGKSLDQWWRIDYTCTMPTHFNTEPTTLDEVLIAAKQESISPILVYASEKALSMHKKLIPRPLEKFVQLDNSIFHGELQESRAESYPVFGEAVDNNQSDLQPEISPSNSIRPDYEYLASDNVENIDERDYMMRALFKNIDENEYKMRALFKNTVSSGADAYYDPYPNKNTEDMAVGIDPSLLQKRNDENSPTQEMVERSSPSKNSLKRETVDQMDLDLEEDQVKHNEKRRTYGS